MNKKMKRQLYKIIIAFILMIIGFFLKLDNPLYQTCVFIGAYLIVGLDILIRAFRNIIRGKVFDENFLMALATIGAFIIGEFLEAVAVMLFYQIGELFQSYAVNKSRKSVASLMDIRPDYANLYINGKSKKVSPDEVSIGDIILVKPGEKVPLDGIVVEGSSLLNTVALTGESVPRSISSGDEVLSGSINQDGILQIKVTKTFGESTVSKILDLVENASSRKSESENFISKFAKYYTPIVVVIALILAFIPPLIFKDAILQDWVYRALSFLVVSCPCALVISIPLSFFGGIGAASKIGVLVKGSNYLEMLARVETVVCDKTGTLTEGVFEVQEIIPFSLKEDRILRYAALAESFSNHPISASLKNAYGKKLYTKKVEKTREIAGMGIVAKIDGKRVLVGNYQLMEKYDIGYIPCHEIGTILYVAVDKDFGGTIIIKDKIKKDSYKAMELFNLNRIKKVVMLTGDDADIGEEVAIDLGIKEYYSELLPQDKVGLVTQLMNETSETGRLLFVGDGINDAPVLALADIGVAMGGLGSDAAIEAADIVIMTDEVSKIASVIGISKKTMRIVNENIGFAISVKITILILSALGIASMWAAVFADVGVSVLAIINALRILRIKSE